MSKPKILRVRQVTQIIGTGRGAPNNPNPRLRSPKFHEVEVIAVKSVKGAHNTQLIESGSYVEPSALTMSSDLTRKQALDHAMWYVENNAWEGKPFRANTAVRRGLRTLRGVTRGERFSMYMNPKDRD